MKVRIEFEKRDLWIGAYWKKSKEYYHWERKEFYPQGRLDLWICLIPCFPLHFIFGKELYDTSKPLYAEEQ